MPRPVEIRIERRLPHAPSAAYEWLTDFRDDDTARAGAVVTGRRILERSEKRVVYDGEQRVLGTTSRGTTEVLLAPPDRWEARVVAGPRTGSATDYLLVPDGAGARLTVTYRLVLQDARRHALLRLLRPLVARELGRMWDGFVASMGEELPRT